MVKIDSVSTIHPNTKEDVLKQKIIKFINKNSIQLLCSKAFEIDGQLFRRLHIQYSEELNINGNKTKLDQPKYFIEYMVDEIPNTMFQIELLAKEVHPF